MSDKDNERLRKTTIAFLKNFAEQGYENAVECIDWLENQSTPQIRTGIEWVDVIDDACDKRHSEEYAEGEYCHEQSFKLGFQEGVAWLENQCEFDETKAKMFLINKGYPIDANGMFPTYEEMYNIIKDRLEKQEEEHNM